MREAPLFRFRGAITTSTAAVTAMAAGVVLAVITSIKASRTRTLGLADCVYLDGCLEEVGWLNVKRMAKKVERK